MHQAHQDILKLPQELRDLLQESRYIYEPKKETPNYLKDPLDVPQYPNNPLKFLND